MITFWKDKARPGGHHCQGQPLAERPRRETATVNLIKSPFAAGTFFKVLVPGVT